jgi:hypothetical protein
MVGNQISHVEIFQATTMFTMDEYITHNQTYNTIIYCQHKLGIPLDWIARHFRKSHKSIPLSTRQAIVSYCKILNLLASENVAIPMEPVQPVHGLPVLDGFQCEYEGCSELRVTRKDMRVKKDFLRAKLSEIYPNR